MQNWFGTLNGSLSAEGLVELWPWNLNIKYGETARVVVEDGDKLRLISIYRDERGYYERPITYITGKISLANRQRKSVHA